MDGIINVVLLLVVLSVLVLLHELGHFIAARRAGVTVHEFGIGFPPRAAVLFRRGDTVYTLNWLPIGGFVRMEGEERSPADGTPDEEPQLQPERTDHVESLDPNAFSNQKLRTRLWILFAGVAVNFVLAWLIFTVIALVAQPVWQVRVADVQPDSPAAAAGMVGGEFLGYELFTVTEDGRPTGEVIPYRTFDDSGDLIVAIDGSTFPVFDEMARAVDSGRIAPLQYGFDHPGETIVVTVERADGTIEDLEVTVRTEEEIAAGDGALGFVWNNIPEYGEVQNGLVDSAMIGLERTAETSTLILRALGNIVVGLFSGSGEALDDVAGPVGMVGVLGDVRAQLPPVFLFWFVGLISANLAVLNALPIPPLDGSRALMAVVQRLSGDRISAATERLVYFAGWVVLMVFIVIVTISDIQRIFE